MIAGRFRISLRLGLIFGAWFSIGESTQARAQTCEPGTKESALQYLRRLSLDLRGRVPDVSELYSAVTNGEVGPEVIDGMLSSEDFVQELRAYHRELLWVNVLDQRLGQNNWILRGPGGRARPSPAYWISANARALAYRGGYVACLDQPATFDPLTQEIQTTPDANDPNVRQEGWVEVNPYWAPTSTVRVCAFDAQANLSAQAVGNPSRADDCRLTTNNPKCGCGPSLSWCQSADPERTISSITASMNEQMLRFTDDIVRNDRPYTEVILGKDLEINGPISHWLRFQTQGGGFQIFALPFQNYDVPEIDFAETDRWVKVTRQDRHSGVLSMPAYLLKFQSNRGRANRFYNAFLCQHFEAPPGGLPAADDACHQEPDLTKRCGCQYCHLAVEPAAAYWGRWAEAGVAPLEESFADLPGFGFPKYRADCDVADGRRAPGICRIFYLSGATGSEAGYNGMLKSYVFADAQREGNIAAGPGGIAEKAIADGSFASCTVKKIWTRMLHREPKVEETESLQELNLVFTRRYSIRDLVRAVVTRPEYVEAGRYGEIRK